MKKIYKILASYEKNYNKIDNFPDLKLYLKCLIDDGSSEAILIANDKNVINLMNFSQTFLHVI